MMKRLKTGQLLATLQVRVEHSSDFLNSRWTVDRYFCGTIYICHIIFFHNSFSNYDELWRRSALLLVHRTFRLCDIRSHCILITVLKIEYWVKVFCLTRHKIGRFQSVFPSRSLGLLLKKLNITQQKANIKHKTPVVNGTSFHRRTRIEPISTTVVWRGIT